MNKPGEGLPISPDLYLDEEGHDKLGGHVQVSGINDAAGAFLEIGGHTSHTSLFTSRCHAGVLSPQNFFRVSASRSNTLLEN